MTKVSEDIAADLKRIGEEMRRAAESAGRAIAPMIRSLNVDAGNDPHVESLSDFLIARDWPTTSLTPSQRIQYRRRAARILAGDPDAIRETWPEVSR